MSLKNNVLSSVAGLLGNSAISNGPTGAAPITWEKNTLFFGKKWVGAGGARVIVNHLRGLGYNFRIGHTVCSYGPSWSEFTLTFGR